MPEFPKCLLVRFARPDDFEFLEAVLATVWTRVPARESLGTALCDRSQSYPWVFRGLSLASAGVSDSSKVERALLLTSSRNPPMAPMTPAASAGRKIVEFFP